LADCGHSQDEGAIAAIGFVHHERQQRVTSNFAKRCQAPNLFVNDCGQLRDAWCYARMLARSRKMVYSIARDEERIGKTPAVDLFAAPVQTFKILSYHSCAAYHAPSGLQHR